jgi:Zn-dependent peptidase ImmA (M78 family)
MMMAELDYTLTWDDDPAADGEAATWGRLLVRCAGQVLWGIERDGTSLGVRWTWIDLLEHLAEVWPWLVWEEGWPPGPALRAPSDFQSASAAWLATLPPVEAAKNEELLLEFRGRHDLAMGVEGLVAPPLWVVREGHWAWITGGGSTSRVSAEHALLVLERLAGDIVTRVAACADERSRDAVTAWQERLSSLGSLDATAIAVGVLPSELRDFALGDVSAAFELEPGAGGATFEPNELMAAARMSAAATDPATVRAVLDAIRTVPARTTPELDTMAAEAATYAEQHLDDDLIPARFGNEMAGWLRRRLGLSVDDRVDLEPLLATWCVYVAELQCPDTAIEAVACWGPRHGPAVLVNPAGRFTSTPHGRRATLAHEVAHLLLDRRSSLPLAEVFGGNVRAEIERRARGFAAELLIPRSVAGSAFRTADAAPEDVLSSLCQKYGVSREIVAWQAYNSGYPMDHGTYALLKGEVSYPSRFLWSVVRER